MSTNAFSVLAEPTRRRILDRLLEADRSVGELVDALGTSQPAVSKHLKVLGDAGLVTRTQRATARLSRLDATPLEAAADWMADYRTYWQDSHDRLDALLTELKENPS